MATASGLTALLTQFVARAEGLFDAAPMGQARELRIDVNIPHVTLAVIPLAVRIVERLRFSGLIPWLAQGREEGENE